MRCAALYFVVMWMCIFTVCADGIPNYNLQISTHQDETFDPYTKIHLDQERGKPLKFSMNHSCDDSVCSDTFIISYNKNGSTEHECIPATITEKKPTVEAEPTVAAKPVPAVLPWYTVVPGFGQYKVYNVKLSWFEAKYKCEKDGAHLFIPNSPNEIANVNKLIKETGTTGYWIWIGLHDQQIEGAYTTIFGDSLASTGYTKWYPRHPYNRADWDCICYRYDDPNGGLGDWDCNINLFTICELEDSK